MYRLIACDLDETLLTTEKKISSKNIAAVKKARQKGVHFVPATGRGFVSIQNTLEKLELLDKKNEYVISFNGGAITENKENLLIDSNLMSFQLIKKLFQVGTKYSVCIHIYTLNKLYVYLLNDPEEEYLNRTMRYKQLNTPSIDFLQQAPLTKILFMNLEKSYLEQIERSLAPDLKSKVDISYSSNRYIEFNPKGVNKGAALLKLASFLKIAPEETIAIGDNSNDATMLLAAGLGVSVQNGIREIKASADYICENNHDQDAVAEVIEKFVL